MHPVLRRTLLLPEAQFSMSHSFLGYRTTHNQPEATRDAPRATPARKTSLTGQLPRPRRSDGGPDGLPTRPFAQLVLQDLLAAISESWSSRLGIYRALLHELLARGWRQLDEPIRMPAWRNLALVVRHGLTGR
jgi:hypothetical protein